MGIYNIDYVKILVLVFLFATFYWLMLPGKPVENTSSSIAVNTESSTLKKTTKSPAAVLEAQLAEKVEVIKQRHAKVVEEKDGMIEKLRQDLDKAKYNDNKSKEKLEAEIDKISAKSDEILKSKNELQKENEELKTKFEELHKAGEKDDSNKVVSSPETDHKTDVKLVPFKGMKLIHMDLKGAPPKVEYFLEVMEISQKFGATGLLIEYEDMFPWSGDLKMVARKNAYTQEQLKNILNKAAELKLEIVPLIQTFGHLEFVLKHKEFATLRAKKDVTTSICPLNNQSLPLIKKMLDQVVDFHQNLKWIHLGGDEVWNVKSCDRCHGNYTDVDLFHRHMIPIMQYVKSKSENLRPVIWDDMMRKWNVSDMKVMAKHVVPMVWGYVSDLSTYRSYPTDMWEKYMQAFPTIFFASSFKGALKPWSNFVPTQQHLDNHLSWLKIFKKYQDNGKKVEGVALTGWSRFDHYGPLCETLPAGIPTMVLCLSILDHGGFDKDVHDKTSKLLGFPKPFQTNVNYFKLYKPENATFKGQQFYNFVGTFEKYNGWKEWAEVRLKGWSRPYNVKKGHLSYFQLNETRHGLEKSSRELMKLRVKGKEVLSNFFDDETVTEWLEDKIDATSHVIDKELKQVKEMISKHF
ncbi:hexosaminidase D-like [Clytia hemisphaerica]|uniref:beta-N-acetylhexosaminidase n=1 Tax=Clytia hemisphaerica TaxID=252671 RepID=A0A7M6DP00_9CNID